MRKILLSALAVSGMALVAGGPENLPSTGAIAHAPALAQGGAARVDQFTTPEGFTVEVAASPEETGSIVAMTFDSRGRPVLSRERGPVLVLEDRDRDSRYDTVLTFTDQVTNCQGLCFVGDDLYAVGDGPEGTGLYRVTDTDGDTLGDRARLIGKFQGPMGEHGPHALIVGPEGMLYVVVGNHAGIRSTPDPLSPHRNYEEGFLLPRYFDPNGHARHVRAPGGTIFRIDWEGKNWELFAAGFRNQYDAAFNLAGELFTFDADMEWDLGLPWFRPVRTHHIVPGGEYGWRAGSAKWPDYFIDSLPAMTDVGRGSPVGVEFYLHYAYPEKYWDSFLGGDWSRGRILVGFLEHDGGTYKEIQEDLVVGNPLNITDFEVGPDGFVYYVTGGRNTTGGLYRIRYRGPHSRKFPTKGIEGALHQPQPRSAWGRARLEKFKKNIGNQWATGLLAKLKDKAAQPALRARALELLQVYGPTPKEALLRELAEDTAPPVRALAVYYLGLHPTSGSRKALLGRLKDSDAFVQRRACEALIRTGINRTIKMEASFVDALWPLLAHSDRFVRYAARELLQRTPRNLWTEKALQEKNPRAAVEGLLAMVETVGGTWDMDRIMTREAGLLESKLADEVLLGLLRVIQLSYIRNQDVQRHEISETVGRVLLERFPASDWRLNRETARLLAYLQTPGAVEKILAALEREEDREQQIFYAYCLRAVPGDWTADGREAFVRWFEKTQKEDWRGGFSFSGFLEAIWKTWLETVPENEKQKIMARLPQFSPLEPAGGKKRISTFSREGWSRKLSEQELTEFLLWDPMAYKGSPEKGKVAYKKASCDQCHRFGEMGREAGPDLTTVGMRFSRQDLIEAIVFPSRIVSEFWQATEITTKKGKSYLGTVSSEDGQAVILQQAGGPRVRIPKSEIANREAAAEKSSMPEGLLDTLTPNEIWDLFAFLEKRAAPPKQGAAKK